MNNTIHFQSEGNVYSESFQNKAEAMFFVENCDFPMLKAKIGGVDLDHPELKAIRKRSRESQEFLTGIPDNFQNILGLLDWYGEMAEVERVYRAGLRAEEDRERRELKVLAQ